MNSTFTAVRIIEHIAVETFSEKKKLATSTVDFCEGDLVPLRTGLVILDVNIFDGMSVQLCMHGVGESAGSYI